MKPLIPLLLLVVAACGGEPIEQVDPASIPEMPTWTADVRPILDRYCQSCHSAETVGGAPDGADFGSYDRTVCEWDEVDEVLRERSMPPGGAPRPTAREAAVLYRWAEVGYPHGEGVQPSCSGGRR